MDSALTVQTSSLAVRIARASGSPEAAAEVHSLRGIQVGDAAPSTQFLSRRERGFATQRACGPPDPGGQQMPLGPAMSGRSLLDNLPSAFRKRLGFGSSADAGARHRRGSVRDYGPRTGPRPRSSTFADVYLYCAALLLVTSTVPVSITGAIFLPCLTLSAFSTPSAPMFFGFCATVAIISPASTLAAALGLASKPTTTTLASMLADFSACTAPSAMLSFDANTALRLGCPVMMFSITDCALPVSQSAGCSATTFMPQPVRPFLEPSARACPVDC